MRREAIIKFKAIEMKEIATKNIDTDLLDRILQLIKKNSVKSLTMSYVAKSLSISKRTLYEIFESKSDMILTALSYFNSNHLKESVRILNNAGNVMEGMFYSHLMYRDVIASLPENFFKELDEFYPEIKNHIKKYDEMRFEQFQTLFQKGLAQGVFRNDNNYAISYRMLHIQMESLKRMEKIFPPDISLLDIYDNIIIGFLRSIASEKGMKLLDKVTNEYKIFKK